jgi:hypothetical protein
MHSQLDGNFSVMPGRSPDQFKLSYGLGARLTPGGKVGAEANTDICCGGITSPVQIQLNDPVFKSKQPESGKTLDKTRTPVSILLLVCFERNAGD